MNKFVDLTGKKFGRLTVIKRVGRAKWVCRCECGNYKEVITSKLVKGRCKSCGCLVHSPTIRKQYKHGLTNNKLFIKWQSMKSRCYYTRNCKFKCYGGRGIKVCDEWLSDFMNFYNWAINNGYKEGLTLDRINVDGDYEPNNCRFITLAEQANNKTNSHYVEYNGIRKTIAEWSRFYNVEYHKFYSMYKRGKVLI